MSDEAARRKINAHKAWVLNKGHLGGDKTEYSVLNGNLVFRPKGSNAAWQIHNESVKNVSAIDRINSSLTPDPGAPAPQRSGSSTPNLNDKSSPYYYGLDSTYKPPARKPAQQRPAVRSPLLAGDPELVGYNLLSNTPRTAQPPKSSSGNITRVGDQEYNMDDPAQVKALNAVLEADRATRPGQKFADLRGGGGLKPDGGGRFTLAPDGNGSTGTNTGFKGADFGEANGLLARLGITSTRYGDFQSNDLPGVENTEFGGSDREIFGGTAEEDRIIQGSGSLETVIDAKQTQGSPKLTQSGAQSITSTVETAPLGSLQRYGQEFMADRPDMPADKSTSMTGLRAAEASKGLLYASGKYWKENPNAGKEGEKDFIEIQKDEWNSIKRGEQHAQEFLQQKMGPVKSEISLTDKQDDYQISDASKPTSSIDSTAQVEPSQITNAPTLTDAVDVSFTDKDRTGRYNIFRRS